MAKNGEHVSARESLPVLEARAKTRPGDPEAHLHLAEAYKAQSQLVGAIGEYKVALALSGGNQEVRDKALSALRQMHVIDDADPLDRRKLELVNGGQFLRAQRKDKNPPDPTVPPNPPNKI
jgi:predicted Zn-dependent protease